jgi:hypothetical protein
LPLKLAIGFLDEDLAGFDPKKSNYFSLSNTSLELFFLFFQFKIEKDFN